MTDEEMVVAYVESGDSQALEQLIDRHFDSMRRLAYSMLLNDVDADDAVQEVFVRVVQGLETFRREAAFSTWLHRVALNTIYGIISRKKRRPMLLGAASETTASELRTAESELEYLELDRAVQDALARLSPELRAALVMTIFEGVAPAEVAKIAGVTRATIYWRIHRARLELKKTLKDWL